MDKESKQQGGIRGGQMAPFMTIKFTLKKYILEGENFVLILGTHKYIHCAAPPINRVLICHL